MLDSRDLHRLLVVHDLRRQGGEMSKADAARFIEHGRRDPLVVQQLGRVPQTATAWVAVAANLGFDFTIDEFRESAQEKLGRALPDDTFVRDLPAPDGELPDAELDAAAGGSGGFGAGMQRMSGGPNDSGPEWVKSVSNIGRGGFQQF
jgi:hypothetical protein